MTTPLNNADRSSGTPIPKLVTDLRLTPVRLPDLDLTVAVPRSAEELIDETEYADNERLPYWAELWPSGRVLAELLAKRDLGNMRVIELGCGVGLPSIVATARGASVLATDWYAEALVAARGNARFTLCADLSVAHLDWLDPSPAVLELAPFDLVIGADLLYEQRNGDALARLLPRLVTPASEVIVTDPRRPHASALIDPLVGAGWVHERTSVHLDGPVDESGPEIHVHTLTPSSTGPGGAPGGASGIVGEADPP